MYLSGADLKEHIVFPDYILPFAERNYLFHGPLSVLKGIYHYSTHCFLLFFFSRGLQQMEVLVLPSVHQSAKAH